MATRQTMLVELRGELEIPQDLPRQQRLAWVQKAERERKQGLIERLDGFRALDPDLEVQGAESIFPLLVVTTTAEVFALLEQDPGVLRLSTNDEASLASNRLARPSTCSATRPAGRACSTCSGPAEPRRRVLETYGP